MSPNPNCTLCPLHKQATTVCVWGRRRGLLAAGSDAMAVGEAPGEREDRIGQPFVGPSGDLIDEALGAAGLTDVYLTNPGAGNFVPTAAALAGGATVTAAQLAALGPAYGLGTTVSPGIGARFYPGCRG